MAFVPLSDSLYVRVWCEPSNLSNHNEQNSTTLAFFVSCEANADDAFIKTIVGEKLEPSLWWLDSAEQNTQCWESLFKYWTKYQHFTRVRTEATLIQATLYTLARWAKTTISFVFRQINRKALQLLILFLTSRQLATMQMRLMLLEMTTTRVTICWVLPTLPTLPVHISHYITQTKIRWEFQKNLHKKTHTFVCKTERCNSCVFKFNVVYLLTYCFILLLYCKNCFET